MPYHVRRRKPCPWTNRSSRRRIKGLRSLCDRAPVVGPSPLDERWTGPGSCALRSSDDCNHPVSCQADLSDSHRVDPTNRSVETETVTSASDDGPESPYFLDDRVVEGPPTKGPHRSFPRRRGTLRGFETSGSRAHLPYGKSVRVTGTE